MKYHRDLLSGAQRDLLSGQLFVITSKFSA